MDYYDNVLRRARAVLEQLYRDRIIDTDPDTGGSGITPEQDEQGRYILYHGSPYKGIKKFLPKQPAYLSTIPEYSAGYAVEAENWNGPKHIKPEGYNLYKVLMQPESYKKLYDAGVELTEEDEDEDVWRAIENSVQRVLDDTHYDFDGNEHTVDFDYEMEPMELTPELLERAGLIEKAYNNDAQYRRLLEVAMKLRGRF